MKTLVGTSFCDFCQQILQNYGSYVDDTGEPTLGTE